ncbi:hypothetical protein KIF59_07485 [Enterobacter cloacae subsp. cloacae]|nr:hypothetical protein [Enterobacter cloacae subsp. cloacae]
MGCWRWRCLASTFRFQPGRQSDASTVPAGTSNELRVLRALNEEIISGCCWVCWFTTRSQPHGDEHKLPTICCRILTCRTSPPWRISIGGDSGHRQ